MNEKKYFIISVDTEADWYHQKENRLNNIEGIHILQRLCKNYNITPTYLVTYEVATDNNSIEILKQYHQKDLCEIGSHLHIWSTPPFEDANEYGVDLKWFHGFQSELPDNLLYQKLENLNKVIIKNFGVRPTSHRAGRWGIDYRTLDWLSNNNYLVDSSICSRKTWNLTRGTEGFMNYNSYQVENIPYYPSSEDITLPSKNKNGENKIIEIPVSNLELNFWSNSNSKRLVLLSTILNKIGFYHFGNISFRPSYNIPSQKFKILVNRLLKKNDRFVNFMLHSNELTDGSSPYSKNKEKQKALIDRINIVFEAAKKYGYKSIKLSKSVDYL